jgi:REP element-mobilizing transposase RayT
MQHRRHLPHIYVIGAPLFVTFRLHGSLPPGRHFNDKRLTSGQQFVCFDQLLDRGSCGPVYLKMPAIAEIVVSAIRRGAVSDYTLHAWVVMPNHVHLLITVLNDVSKALQKLKGVYAMEANQHLGLRGRPFWQRESYDRLVRDDAEFRRVENYIVENPVKAGLAQSIEKYRWSSAWAPIVSSHPRVGLSQLQAKACPTEGTIRSLT